MEQLTNSGKDKSLQIPCMLKKPGEFIWLVHPDSIGLESLRSYMLAAEKGNALQNSPARTKEKSSSRAAQVNP